MGEMLCLVVTVQVLSRRGECRIGSAANDDPVVAFGHRFYKRTRFIAGSLPRHPFGHSHHHIDHQVTLTLDFCVGVHLQKRNGQRSPGTQRPPCRPALPRGLSRIRHC
jgi:hypothetical protein